MPSGPARSTAFESHPGNAPTGADAPSIIEQPREGLRELGGARILLLRPEVLVNIQKQLERTVGLSTRGFLYLAGEQSAKDALSKVDPIPSASFEETIPRTLETLTDLGWGRFRLLPGARDPVRWTIRLEDSPLAAAYGPAPRPVCHLVAGWLAGLVEHLSGVTLLCEEVQCQAQGRPRCEFELRSAPFP